VLARLEAVEKLGESFLAGAVDVGHGRSAGFRQLPVGAVRDQAGRRELVPRVRFDAGRVAVAEPRQQPQRRWRQVE
jgi:hypothetical protein